MQLAPIRVGHPLRHISINNISISIVGTVATGRDISNTEEVMVEEGEGEEEADQGEGLVEMIDIMVNLMKGYTMDSSTVHRSVTRAPMTSNSSSNKGPNTDNSNVTIHTLEVVATAATTKAAVAVAVAVAAGVEEDSEIT